MGVEGIGSGTQVWTWEAEDTRRRDALLEGAFDAALAAAGRDGLELEPVGGSRWINAQGRALFDGDREVVGEKNGLPIVAASREEREASVAYLKSQAAARGQDPEAQTFITLRAPVFDGALGPLVGYYETPAMQLDMSGLTPVKLAPAAIADLATD